MAISENMLLIGMKHVQQETKATFKSTVVTVINMFELSLTVATGRQWTDNTFAEDCLSFFKLPFK